MIQAEERNGTRSAEGDNGEGNDSEADVEWSQDQKRESGWSQKLNDQQPAESTTDPKRSKNVLGTQDSLQKAS